MTSLSNKIRVLAFDPANTDMGWAVLLFDPKTNLITCEVSGVIEGRSLASDFPRWAKLRLPKPFLSSIRTFDIIKKLIHQYKIHYVCSESAFYGKFPQVWASLSIIIYNIRRAAFELIHDTVHVVSPSETKLVVSGKGGSGKDAVKRGVLKYKGLTISPPTGNRKVTELEEHEYDAIGHGIAFIKLKYPEVKKIYEKEENRIKEEAAKKLLVEQKFLEKEQRIRDRLERKRIKAQEKAERAERGRLKRLEREAKKKKK